MTAKDIILTGKSGVRNSPVLYPIYQNQFKEAFGFFPECPTCGSSLGNKHWAAFENFVNGANPETLLSINDKSNSMSNTDITFRVKNKNRIYAYNFKSKESGRILTNRVYGDLMTEEFANAYLDAVITNKEELDRRKSEFSILPEKFRTKVDEVKPVKEVQENEVEEDKTKVELAFLKFEELKSIASEKGYPQEEWGSLKSKKDLAAYIEAKELDDLI